MACLKHIYKKIFYTVWFLIVGISSSAFATPVDSLIKLLKTDTTNTYKADVFIQITQHYVNENEADLAQHYAKRSLEFVNDHDLSDKRSAVLRLYGRAIELEKKYKQALPYLNESLASSLRTRNKDDEVKALMALSNFYKRQQDHPNQVEHLFKALTITADLDQHAASALICDELAHSFIRHNEMARAREYIAQGLQIRNEHSLQVERGNSFYLLGLLHQQLNDVDSSMYYMNRAERYFVLAKDTIQLAQVYAQMGSIYSKDKTRLNTAEAYINKSLNLSRKQNHTESIIQNYISGAEIDFIKGDYKTTKLKLNKAEELNEVSDNLFFAYSIEKNRARVLQKQGKYKLSLQAEQLANRYQDSLFNLERTAVLNDVAQKYDFEKSQRRNLQLENENLENQANLRKITILALFFGILLAVAALGYFLIFRYYKLKQKAADLEVERNKALHSQRISELENMAEIKAINAMLDGREYERESIAQTLHDSVSTLLSSATLHLQAYKNKTKNGTAPINRAQEIIGEASDKLRLLSHNMISSVLLNFGLSDALSDLCEKISTDELTFTSNVTGGYRRLPQQLESKVYHIIQELVNNILKHSRASEASILVERKDQKLYIEVEDNGVGYDINKIDESHGIGLNQIRARVKAMGGDIYIDSKIEKGFKVNITLPVKNVSVVLKEDIV